MGIIYTKFPVEQRQRDEFICLITFEGCSSVLEAYYMFKRKTIPKLRHYNKSNDSRLDPASDDLSMVVVDIPSVLKV